MSSQRIDFVRAVRQGKKAVVAKRHKPSPPRQLNRTKRRKTTPPHHVPQSTSEAGPSASIGVESLQTDGDFEDMTPHSSHKHGGKVTCNF